MHHDLGGDTRDHIALGTPHPTEHQLPATETEHNIRRNGTRSIWAGTLLLVTDITTALALMTYARHHNWDDPVTRQFVGLTIILVGLGATALLTSGLIERQQRQQRTLIRRAMARADMNAGVGETNRAAIEKNTQFLADVIYQINYARKDIAGLSKRVEAVEEGLAKVPDFADGFSRGAFVTATSLGLEKGE